MWRLWWLKKLKNRIQIYLNLSGALRCEGCDNRDPYIRLSTHHRCLHNRKVKIWTCNGLRLCRNANGNETKSPRTIFADVFILINPTFLVEMTFIAYMYDCCHSIKRSINRNQNFKKNYDIFFTCRRIVQSMNIIQVPGHLSPAQP